MLNSNPNFDRSNSPDRPAGGAPGYAPPRPPADSAETRIPVLGKTLLFRGELTAEEDVILQGRVEGSIRHARNLIIGTDGSVLGDVYASHLTVEGLSAYMGIQVIGGFVGCVSAGYLLDALGAIDTEKVEIGLTDANSSCLIHAPGTVQTRYVVMPMRL